MQNCNKRNRTLLHADFHDYQYSKLTDKIIKAFYCAYNKLGYGFLEKVYENALAIELRKENLDVLQQFPINVHYNDEIIGEYFADLVVEQKVIVEIKAAKSIAKEHEAQLLNYLKATQIEVGLLLNFGPKPAIRRKVFSNRRKGNQILSD
jgi:GxxExxY protein